MEGLNAWLVGVAGAAMIAAIAVALTPEGFARKVARFTGGLLLMLAVLGPVKELDLDELAGTLAKYRAQQQGAAEAMAAENEEGRKGIIEQEAAAYISDKAKSLGLSEVRVEVKCVMTEEGYPAPKEVYVAAAGDGEAWKALQKAITADFAIEESRQTLERKEAE